MGIGKKNELKEILNSLRNEFTYLKNNDSASSKNLKSILSNINKFEKFIDSYDLVKKETNFYFKILYISKHHTIESQGKYVIEYFDPDNIDQITSYLKEYAYQFIIIDESINSDNFSDLETVKNICIIDVSDNESKNNKFYHILREDLQKNLERHLNYYWNVFNKMFYINKIKNKKKFSALIVEDDLYSQRSLKELFSIYDINADTSNNAKSAVEMVSIKSYDFIILDLGLPDMEGDELSVKIRNIQSSLRYFLCPIIVNTGKEIECHSEKFSNKGISEFYQKPNLAINLKECLEKYLPYVNEVNINLS